MHGKPTENRQDSPEKNHETGSEAKNCQQTQEVLSALGAEKKFNESIINSLPGVFYLFDTNLRFKRWNKNFEKVTGYSSREIARITPLELFDEHDKPLVAERIQEVFEKGSSSVEANFLTKGGEKIPYLFTGHLTNIENCQYLIGMGIDISARKLAEGERETLIHDLAERVKELRCMYGIAASIRKHENLADVFTDVIELIPAGWHYPEITMARVRFDDGTYQSRDFEKTPWSLSRDILVSGKKRGTVEVYLKEARWASDSSMFLSEERDLIDAIAKALSEFIERQEAREELRKSQERFRAIYELGLVGLSITSPDKGWLQVNDALCANLGYSREELLNTTWADLTHPDDLAEDLVRFEQMRAGEINGYSLEKRFIKKDGQVMYANLVVRCVRKDDGQIDYVVAMVQDITHRKMMEIRLHNTLRDLARSNKELEQFAYVASHDLQEPLRMVASFTQLLRRRYKGQLDEKADKYIEFAVEGAQRMQTLINDLLALSRIGSGAKSMELVDCEEIVARIVQKMEQSTGKKNARIRKGRLPRLHADPDELFSLFENLIENAVKFNDNPIAEVNITAQRAGPFWQFRVSDNGIGIEEKYHERIFALFQRLHQRGRYEGSGVGLALVKKVVARHGGTIRVESTPGAGSTFIFSLLANIENGSIENG